MGPLHRLLLPHPTAASATTSGGPLRPRCLAAPWGKPPLLEQPRHGLYTAPWWGRAARGSRRPPLQPSSTPTAAPPTSRPAPVASKSALAASKRSGASGADSDSSRGSHGGPKAKGAGKAVAAKGPAVEVEGVAAQTKGPIVGAAGAAFAPDYLEGLNPEQLAAVTAPLGPTSVVAGPGCGKTRVLTSRVAYLLDRMDVQPRSVLAITFTNKAARELSARLEAAVGEQAKMTFTGTFHRLAVGLLRANLRRWPGGGLTSEFAILDSDDVRSLVNKMLTDMETNGPPEGVVYKRPADPQAGPDPWLAGTIAQKNGVVVAGPVSDEDEEEEQDYNRESPAARRRNHGKFIQSGISSLKNLVPTAHGMTGDQLVAYWKAGRAHPSASNLAGLSYWDCRPEALAAFYDVYSATCRQLNSADFDDLLSLVVALLKEVPGVAERVAARYRHVLIDEFQDTNAAQYELARLLTQQSGNLYVVGDPNQAIYGFRGANNYNMTHQLPKDFPGLNTYQLPINYRSRPEVTKAADGLWGRFPAHYLLDGGLRPVKPKSGVDPTVHSLANGNLASSRVVEVIQSLMISRGYGWEDFAILMRTNREITIMEGPLNLAGIPYRVLGGTRFWEREEVKHCIAYLRLAATLNDDLALLRVLNTPSRGIGPKGEGQLLAIAKASGVTLSQLLLGDLDELYPGGAGQGAGAAPSPGAWEEIPLPPGLLQVKLNKKEREGLQTLRLVVARMRDAAFTSPALGDVLRRMVTTLSFDAYLAKKAAAEKKHGKKARAPGMTRIDNVNLVIDMMDGLYAQEESWKYHMLDDEEGLFDRTDGGAGGASTGMDIGDGGSSSSSKDLATSGVGMGMAIGEGGGSGSSSSGVLTTSSDAAATHPSSFPSPEMQEQNPALQRLLQAVGPEGMLDRLLQFIESAALSTDNEQADRLQQQGGGAVDSGRVLLCTLHAAKGLEFPVVFMPGMMDEVFPRSEVKGKDPVEEFLQEVRLAYVGFTRAKEELHLLWHAYDPIRTKSHKPSQFLRHLLPEGRDKWVVEPPVLRGGPGQFAGPGTVRDSHHYGRQGSWKSARRSPARGTGSGRLSGSAVGSSGSSGGGRRGGGGGGGGAGMGLAPSITPPPATPLPERPSGKRNMRRRAGP